MNRLNPSSIRTKIIIVFVVFALIQLLAFFVLIEASGITKAVYEQSYSSFNYMVINRGKTLAETLNSARSGFVPVATQINTKINEYLSNTPYSFGASETDNELLGIAAGPLIDFLNSTKESSGLYIYLDDFDGNGEHDCLYIRDNNYGGNIRGEDSKTYIRGPSSIAKQYNLQLYYLWQQKQNFDFFEKNNSLDFYTKPIYAMTETNTAYSNSYYWSYPYRISTNDPLMITLSMPLIDKNGRPIGVCGFELSSDLLKRLLPYTELSNKLSVYALGDGPVKNINKNFFTSGALGDQLFIENTIKVNPLSTSFNMSRLEFLNTNLQDFISVETPIEVYNKTSVYSDEQWVLNGLVELDAVVEYPTSIFNLLILAEIVILIVSLLYIVYASFRLTYPIKNLSELVIKLDPEEPVNLPRTHIKEIDELSGAVEKMSVAVSESASRLNNIIDMVDVAIGGFEERFIENKVLLTNSMARILSLPEGTKSLGFTEWTDILQKLEFEKSGDICRLVDEKTAEEKWLRLRTGESGINISGVIMDVTAEITELRRAQYERDFDSMTKILNRHAFMELLREKIDNKVYRSGAMILLDLDNLKFINDSYGHDIGDMYLVKLAESLKAFEGMNGMISRMAGDEFTIFLPCEPEEIGFKDYIILTLDQCKREGVTMPDGSFQRLRFSAGISWYPEDSSDLDVLVKYADFAMYETKHNIKGTVGEFKLNVYEQKAILTSQLESFDRLVENEELFYVFQPVVNARDGSIYAYEILMRSNIDGLRTPYEILAIAKQQSKLYYIEFIGLKKMFEIMLANPDIFEHKKIFFNTISSVYFKDEDWNFFVENYKDLFKMVITEITETEDYVNFVHSDKLGRFKSLGSGLAIDDFGSGYNGEVVLVKTSPDFVKIDISLVRDIHLDENKQTLVKNIIDYCKQRNIKTIGEGIETYEELKILTQMGIDYHQGFYLGRPERDFYGIPEQMISQIKALNNE